MLSLLLRRCPGLGWDSARVAACVEDFPDASHREVAGRCADYIATKTGVRDGPRTLRTFYERDAAERRSRRQASDLRLRRTQALAIYHRPLNT